MRGSVLFGVAAALVVPQLALSQDRSAAVDPIAATVDRVFDAFRATDGPGCALGVSRGGRVVYEHGYGMANLETGTPITPASIFHVASVSKQFTAMSIMLLARDGKLSVDDNIRKYLPEIPDYGTPITIRHLLTHTSGLRDQWDLIALARGRFEEDRITEADVMDIIPRQKALNFTPGAEYLYSNTGFTLLGVIVKRVSGESLRDFADQRIFKPLGMTHTHFHDDYTMLVPGRTSAYEPRNNEWHVGIPNFDVYGATNLFTTVGDLLKWEANFDNLTVGDKAILDRMQARTPLTSGDTSNYGFGLVMSQYRGVREVGHNGADAGYRSYVGRFPDQGLAIAIECNASNANTTALAHGVANAYLGSALTAIPAPPNTRSAEPVSAASLELRVGTYLEPRTLVVVELTMHDGHLTYGRIAGPTLVPLADNEFRLQPGGLGKLVFAHGFRAGFETRSAEGKLLDTFERPLPAIVSSAALAAFAGEYFSDELNARYVITSDDSTLSLRTGTSDAITARPVFLDGFLGDGYTIQFSRSGNLVTGFEISDGRVRRVRFVRKSQ